MAKIKMQMRIGWALVIAAVLIAGCESATMDNQGSISLAELQGITVEPTTTDPGTTTTTPDATTTTDPGTTTTTADGTSTNVTAGGWPAEIDGPITWLHTDVSSWPVTTTVDASVGGSTINFPYDKTRVWPAADGVNANPWVIVKWTDGRWYAATFEYLRVGQTSKPKGVLDGSKGDHIKKSPLSSWRPHSGERFGIMVSGLARSNLRNVRERSNVDMVTWP